MRPFIWVNLLLFLAWGWLVGINHDDAEHLHCAWMVSRGLVPFKDFWQHHSPLWWLILVPFFKIIKPTVLIFDMTRIFCAFIFLITAVIAWQIAKKVFQKDADLLTFLLILLSGSIYGQYVWLRPDLFMYIFLLFGIYFSLEIPGKKILPSFFCGISFALAASFVFKQYLLYLLPVIVILLEKNKLSIYKLLVFFAGLFAGSTPLLFYLLKNNILTEFIFWVFKFNRQRIVTGAVFPFALGFMGIWGACLLLNRYRNYKETKSLILFIALCLSTLSSLTYAEVFYSYYLGLWYILCAVASSGCKILELSEKISSIGKKTVALGLFFTCLITPNYMLTKTHRGLYYFEDRQTISKLLKYCAKDTCFVFLPLHPIFSDDATWLYSWWQYYWIDKYLKVKKDVKTKNITQDIMTKRPAVIAYKFPKENFLVDMFMKKLISADDSKKLCSFLKENYTIVYVGGYYSEGKYYIRNDKLKNFPQGF